MSIQDVLFRWLCDVRETHQLTIVAESPTRWLVAEEGDIDVPDDHRHATFAAALRDLRDCVQEDIDLNESTRSDYESFVSWEAYKADMRRD